MKHMFIRTTKHGQMCAPTEMSWLLEHMHTVECVSAGTDRVSELRREQERTNELESVQ